VDLAAAGNRLWCSKHPARGAQDELLTHFTTRQVVKQKRSYKEKEKTGEADRSGPRVRCVHSSIQKALIFSAKNEEAGMVWGKLKEIGLKQGGR